MFRLLPFAAAAVLAAAEPDPAAALLAEAQAAGAARAALAAEAAAWRDERERLQTLVTAAEGEADRLAASAEADRRAAGAARAEAAALSPPDPAPALTAAATMAAAALRALAARHPPGAVALPADGVGEAAVAALLRALDAGDRAAGEVAIEIVTGEQPGRGPRAVSLLRVSGAAAWWVSLDGGEAGTARMHDGVLRLTPAEPADAAAIRRAVAILQGRQGPGLVDLPDPG
ncbi:MAG: hypothetical protein RLZZ127_2508, partial [Planctomycetota bacterium]